VNLLGLRAELFLCCRIRVIRQDEQNLFDPCGFLSLIFFPMFPVIFSDFLVRHRHPGFDVPPDQLDPHELIPNTLSVGLHAQPVLLQGLEELFLRDLPLFPDIADRLRHLFIRNGDLRFAGFLLHQKIVDHSIQKEQPVIGNGLLPVRALIGGLDPLLIGDESAVPFGQGDRLIVDYRHDAVLDFRMNCRTQENGR